MRLAIGNHIISQFFDIFFLPAISTTLAVVISN